MRSGSNTFKAQNISLLIAKNGQTKAYPHLRKFQQHIFFYSTSLRIVATIRLLYLFSLQFYLLEIRLLTSGAQSSNFHLCGKNPDTGIACPINSPASLKTGDRGTQPTTVWCTLVGDSLINQHSYCLLKPRQNAGTLWWTLFPIPTSDSISSPFLWVWFLQSLPTICFFFMFRRINVSMHRMQPHRLAYRSYKFDPPYHILCDHRGSIPKWKEPHVQGCGSRQLIIFSSIENLT